jgi:hypothetical protein
LTSLRHTLLLAIVFPIATLYFLPTLVFALFAFKFVCVDPGPQVRNRVNNIGRRAFEAVFENGRD